MDKIELHKFNESTYKIDIIEDYQSYKFVGHYREKKYLFFGPIIDKTYTIKFFRIIGGIGFYDFEVISHVSKDKKDDALNAIFEYKKINAFESKVVESIGL
jgi:hypothetical protein